MFQADQPCSLNRCSCSAAKLACTIFCNCGGKSDVCFKQYTHDILAVLPDEDDEDDDNTDDHDNK
jgi:hypothetical protein